MVGLIITINKYKSYFSSNTETFVFNDNNLDNVQTKLVSYLTDIIINLNIDFPQELDEFEVIWFNQNYVNTSFFNYHIFNNELWSQPWDNQDIYSLVLDNLIKVQQDKNIDYSQLYDESTIEEKNGFYSNNGINVDADDLETLDNMINEHMNE